jgi:hypothetical protein
VYNPASKHWGGFETDLLTGRIPREFQGGSYIWKWATTASRLGAALHPEVQDSGLLTTLLVPCPADLKAAYHVSPLVNSPGNESPECV